MLSAGCAPRPLFESTVPAGEDAFECATEEARSREWSIVETKTYPDEHRAVSVRSYPGSVVQETLVIIVTRNTTPRQLSIKLTGKPFVAPAVTTGGAVPGQVSVGGTGVSINKKSRASERSTEDAQAILSICAI